MMTTKRRGQEDRPQTIIAFIFLLCALLIGGADLAQAQSDPANFNTVIDVPPTIIGNNQSIGSDTQLNILVGGVVGREFNIGNPDGSSTNVEVNVLGGTLDFRPTANAGSTVNILDGNVGNGFFVNDGSLVNISGGTVGSGARANSGSAVNVSGGSVGFSFSAISGSTVDISGGSFGGFFDALSGSTVNLRGGTVGQNFDAQAGSMVTITGGDFFVNGAAPFGPTFTLTGNDVFTGTLEDGSVFVFSPQRRDELNSVALQLVALPAIDLTPIVVAAPNDPAPAGLRFGQSLTLQGSGVLGDNFATVSATLNVEGGAIGDGLEVVDSVVNIAGGSVGRSFAAFSGSRVEISGGMLEETTQVFSDSTVNITGGIVGDFLISSGSSVDISGGTVRNFFTHVRPGGTLTVSGGDVPLAGGGGSGQFLLAENDSTVNLVVTELSLDGVPLGGLIPGTAVEIAERIGVFSGSFADGSSFTYHLHPLLPASGGGEISPNATFTVMLVPEPTALLLTVLGGMFAGSLTRRRRA